MVYESWHSTFCYGYNRIKQSIFIGDTHLEDLQVALILVKTMILNFRKILLLYRGVKDLSRDMKLILNLKRSVKSLSTRDNETI